MPSKEYIKKNLPEFYPSFQYVWLLCGHLVVECGLEIQTENGLTFTYAFFSHPELLGNNSKIPTSRYLPKLISRCLGSACLNR